MAPPILLSAMMPAVSRHLDDKHQLVHSLSTRDLQNPTHTQRVTLGVIAAYVVAIAILWNVPYLKMILWPFKVSSQFWLRI